MVDERERDQTLSSHTGLMQVLPGHPLMMPCVKEVDAASGKTSTARSNHCLRKRCFPNSICSP